MKKSEKVKVKKNHNQKLHVNSSQKILNSPQQQVLIQSKEEQTIAVPNQQIQECQFQPITSAKTRIYAQPIVYNPVQPNLVIVNQQLPALTPPRLFSVYPQDVVCPFCLQKITTVVEEDFNCLTCMCLCFMILTLPFLCCAGGSCSCSDCRCNCCNCKCDCKCCYDGIHKCPLCGQIIGRYDSCKKNSY